MATDAARDDELIEFAPYERSGAGAAADAAWLSEVPAHLRDDAPKQQCTACRRFTVDTSEFGADCGMPQPSGGRCTGRFAEVEG